MAMAIIGGGAMGSLWAGLLGLAGVADLWVVEKDQERYGVMQELGNICFHPVLGETRKIPITVVNQMEALPLSRLDSVILAVKAYQVDTVLAELLPLLPAGIPVLCLANGAGFGGESLLTLWQQQGRLAPCLPKLGQVFFAVSFQGAYLVNPGEVSARGEGAVYWGSLPPASHGYVESEASKKVLAEILSLLPMCFYAENFVDEMWRKLLVNSVINPLTALWQIPNGGLASHDLTGEQRRWKEGLLAEGIAVAHGYGREVLGREDFLPAATVTEALAETIAATAENYSSMYQDTAYHRKTEIDYLNGYLLKWGKCLGVSTPCHQEVYQQMKATFSG
ncbi:MAG: 2-dehydropantoate 2-reductase [Peptococcaceae bacterium]|jgi:2-dehydropantoate 2-reductase|nr:2-dehydropantoate 2-reductase [Peptococcaceae bacterium]